jgi:hypothetical protein
MKVTLSLVAALISCTAATPLQPLKIISSRQLESCPAGGNLPPNYLAPTMMVPVSAKFPNVAFGSTKTPCITPNDFCTRIAEVDTLHSRDMRLAQVQRIRRRITTSRLPDRVLPNHRRSLAQVMHTRSMWDHVGWSLRTVWKLVGCCVVMIQRIRICRLRGMNLGARLGSLLLLVRRICWEAGCWLVGL